MIRLGIILTVSAVIAGGGCQTTEKAAPLESPSLPAAPAVPAEVQAVAETALGSGTEVLASGDLAHNGRLQALAVNRPAGDRKQVSQEPGSAITASRAVVLEQESGRWHEVLR